LVPFARGMSPFAFRDDRMVNPMDLPFFHNFTYFRLRLVARYPPPMGTFDPAAHGHAPPVICGAVHILVPHEPPFVFLISLL
jgi:hypothetical protein